MKPYINVAIGYERKEKLFQNIPYKYYKKLKDMMGRHKNIVINGNKIEGLYIWYLSVSHPKGYMPKPSSKYELEDWELVCNYKNTKYFGKKERKSKSLFDFAKS